MSEPVSNVEIEDVLSSIRRLVSEENRPTARRESDDTPRKPSRLVLTPSLLVPVPDTVEPPADPAGEAQDDRPETPESGADIPESAPAPQEVTETETASDDTDKVDWDQTDAPTDHQDDFVEASDTDSTALLDLSQFEADSGADTDFAAESDVEAEVESEVEAEVEMEVDKKADPVAESAAEPDVDSASEPEVDSDPTPWRDPETTLYEAAETTPDLAFLPSEQSEQDENPQEGAFATDDAAPDAEHAPHADPDTAEDVQDQPAPDDDAQPVALDPFNTATLSAKIAVLEAKIGETQDQWEPDGETDDDYAGTPVQTIQWQDHTDEEVDEAPDPDPVAEPEIAVTPQPQATADVEVDEPLDFLPEDETILDEESLRELVADIVRQELQGALGERITRNVRKLVRREIHRALTAQELD
ncbi:MAG: hypothetical protein COC12_04325 [Rhodobacteraceae bacterium]|nr:MAG: hypothetical protein COC12_04325 [Paracoccaceae bacterium]